MKRLRIIDLPLIVKIGFAPALAIVLMAALAMGAMAAQARQARGLQEVAQQRFPDTLALQSLSERMTQVHGQVYLLLSNQAAGISADSIKRQIGDLSGEIARIHDAAQPLAVHALGEEKPVFDSLLAGFTETQTSLEDLRQSIEGGDGAQQASLARFEDQYGRLDYLLDSVVESTNARTQASVAAHLCSWINCPKPARSSRCPTATCRGQKPSKPSARAPGLSIKTTDACWIATTSTP